MAGRGKATANSEVRENLAKRWRLLTFVVVGGGPTSVEMASAVNELARDALAADFHFINPRAWAGSSSAAFRPGSCGQLPTSGS